MLNCNPWVICWKTCSHGNSIQSILKFACMCQKHFFERSAQGVVIPCMFSLKAISSKDFITTQYAQRPLSENMSSYRVPSLEYNLHFRTSQNVFSTRALINPSHSQHYNCKICLRTFFEYNRLKLVLQELIFSRGASPLARQLFFQHEPPRVVLPKCPRMRRFTVKGHMLVRGER